MAYASAITVVLFLIPVSSQDFFLLLGLSEKKVTHRMRW
jgi:hypothetical protein